VYYFVLDMPQFVLMKLYNVRVLLNMEIAETFKLIKEILT